MEERESGGIGKVFQVHFRKINNKRNQIMQLYSILQLRGTVGV